MAKISTFMGYPYRENLDNNVIGGISYVRDSKMRDGGRKKASESTVDPSLIFSNHVNSG